MAEGLHIWHYGGGWRYWHNYDAVAQHKRQAFYLFGKAADKYTHPDLINPWWCAKFDDDNDEKITESEMAMTKDDIISKCALHVAEGD